MPHSFWLEPIFDPKKLEKVGSKIFKELEKLNKTEEIHAIAVSGISGITVGALVSFLTKIPLIIVRKTTGDCHSSLYVEYDWSTIYKRVTDKEKFEGINYVIIDDLIASGDTIKRIHHRVIDSFNQANLKYIYLYNDCKNYHGTYSINNIFEIPVHNFNEKRRK